MGVFLEIFSVMFRSGIKEYVCLLVMKAEASAGVACAKYTLYAMRSVQSLELKVKLPMTIHGLQSCSRFGD